MTPLRPCRQAGCRSLIPFTDTYCERHVRNVSRTYEQARRTRNPEYAAFYHTPAWRNTRKVALVRDDYLCRLCLSQGTVKPAEMVDHIVPVLVDWERRLDLGNLQSLCNACHNRKTADDEKKYGASDSLPR